MSSSQVQANNHLNPHDQQQQQQQLHSPSSESSITAKQTVEGAQLARPGQGELLSARVSSEASDNCDLNQPQHYHHYRTNGCLQQAAATTNRNRIEPKLSVVIPSVQKSLVTPTIITSELTNGNGNFQQPTPTPTQLFNSLIQLNTGQDAGLFTGLPSCTPTSADALVTTNSINPFFWNVAAAASASAAAAAVAASTPQLSGGPAAAIGPGEAGSNSMESSAQQSERGQQAAQHLDSQGTDPMAKERRYQLNKLSLEHLHSVTNGHSMLSPIFILSPEQESWFRLGLAQQQQHQHPLAGKTAEQQHQLVEDRLQASSRQLLAAEEAADALVYQQQLNQQQFHLVQDLTSASSQLIAHHHHHQQQQQQLHPQQQQQLSPLNSTTYLPHNPYSNNSQKQLISQQPTQQQPQYLQAQSHSNIRPASNAAGASSHQQVLYSPNQQLAKQFDANTSASQARLNQNPPSVAHHQHSPLDNMVASADQRLLNFHPQRSTQYQQQQQQQLLQRSPITIYDQHHFHQQIFMAQQNNFQQQQQHIQFQEARRQPVVNKSLTLDTSDPISIVGNSIRPEAPKASGRIPSFSAANVITTNSAQQVVDSETSQLPNRESSNSDDSSGSGGSTSESTGGSSNCGNSHRRSNSCSDSSSFSDLNVALIEQRSISTSIRSSVSRDNYNGSADITQTNTRLSDSNVSRSEEVLPKKRANLPQMSLIKKIKPSNLSSPNKIESTTAVSSIDNNPDQPIKKKSKGGRKKKLITAEEMVARKNRSKERNRVAAKRCRQKRKQFLDELRGKIDILNDSNRRLQKENAMLKSEFDLLKQHHKDCKLHE